MAGVPFYSIYNVGEYTFSPWKVIWPEQPGNNGLPAAVINTREICGLKNKVIIPDHKIYFAGFEEPEKAYFLCGLLMCDFVQDFIMSFHVMIQVGDIFRTLRLPEYNASNDMHVRLRKLVQEAHFEKEPAKREQLLREINKLGKEIITLWNP